ncbi:hypothetical protein ABFS83_03G064300 [Erythranthe nasuta]
MAGHPLNKKIFFVLEGRWHGVLARLSPPCVVLFFFLFFFAILRSLTTMCGIRLSTQQLNKYISIFVGLGYTQILNPQQLPKITINHPKFSVQAYSSIWYSELDNQPITRYKFIFIDNLMS